MKGKIEARCSAFKLYQIATMLTFLGHLVLNCNSNHNLRRDKLFPDHKRAITLSAAVLPPECRVALTVGEL